MRQNLGCSYGGLLGIGPLQRWVLGGLPQPISGLPVAECRDLRPEAGFDQFGIFGRQRVLGGQAPVGPAGRLVG